MPSHLLRAAWGGCLSIATGVLTVQAQNPHSQSTTSAVEQLGLGDTSAKAVATGRTRELRCRGKIGIDLRVDQDPSPRQPKTVAMSLRYERPKAVPSVSYEGMGMVYHGMSLQFLPGNCTWNLAGLADIPPEPGVVYFDLPRDAQFTIPAKARDTTINAAAFYPDVPSLTRYLNDPDRYWVFYVDDLTDISISYSAWPRGGGVVPDSSPSGPPSADHSFETSRDQRTTAVSSVTPVPSTGAAAGPVQGASTDRAGSEGPATAPSTAPTPGPSSDEEKPGTPPSKSSTSSPTPAATGEAAKPRTPTDKSSTSREKAESQRTSRLKHARADRQVRLANGIRNVAAAPGPRGVRLSFQADGAGDVRVQFSEKAPHWDDRTGHWGYGDGWGGPWFAKLMRPVFGRPYEAIPWHKLEIGARYHYLITVKDDDGSVARQRMGVFTARLGS